MLNKLSTKTILSLHFTVSSNPQNNVKFKINLGNKRIKLSALRRIFNTKIDEPGGEWRKLHSEDLCRF
jgi:hypothetical protein